MTSHVTWLDIVRQCEQELEQDRHRYVTCSIESLLAAVSEVFRQQQTADNNNKHHDTTTNTTTNTAVKHP